MSETKKNANVQETVTPEKESGIAISREELENRLAEALQRANVAENDAAILRECIVRLSLERTGVLR